MKHFILIAMIAVLSFGAIAQQTPQEIYDLSVVYHQVNPQNSSNSLKNKLVSFLKKRREAIKDFQVMIHQKTPITSATLVRGSKKTSIDLSKPLKLETGDKIELNEGVYNQFPEITESGVIIVGQGKEKTFITSGKDGSHTFMFNGTGLWDLTLVDVRLAIMDDPIWLAQGKAVGNFQVATQRPSQYPFESVLSDLSMVDLEYYKNFNIPPYIPPGDTFWAHHLLSITEPAIGYSNLYVSLSRFWPQESIAQKSRAFNQLISNLEKQGSSGDYNVYKFNFSAEILEPFNSLFLQMIEEQDQLNPNSEWADARRAAKKMTRKLAYYAYEKGFLERKSMDLKKSEKLRQQSAAQEKKGKCRRRDAVARRSFKGRSIF